jgi:8-oxo-dGTP pyrophosphatase MutT (NUDIX family)
MVNSSPINIVAGGIIYNEEDEVVLVSQFGTSWSFPKGHLEANEKPIDAALREIYEETGIKVLKYKDNLGSYVRSGINKEGQIDPLQIKRIHFFLFFSPKVNLKPKDLDNPEAVWVPKQLAGSYLTHVRDRIFYRRIFNKIGLDYEKTTF